MALPLRVRLLGAMVAKTTGRIEGMSPELRHKLRHPDAPKFLTDLMNGKRAGGVTVTDRTVPGEDGAIPVRVYVPSGELTAGRPLVVNFAGGGWMFGGLHSSDWLASTLAVRLDAVVVTVACRLAPEHPAPAAVRDAVCATSWLAKHATELGAREGALAVIGDSSGGNLAAAVTLVARDNGTPAIDAQVLVYPATDLTMSGASVEQIDEAPFLRTDDLRSYVAAYLGADGDPRDPLLSPHWAPDLSGLPPALVIGADTDPLRDDARRYASRLTEASVPVRHVEYADSPHGFLTFPRACRASGPAVDDIVQMLQSALAPSGRASDRRHA
jgi:acetyl esterase